MGTSPSTSSTNLRNTCRFASDLLGAGSLHVLTVVTGCSIDMTLPVFNSSGSVVTFITRTGTSVLLPGTNARDTRNPTTGSVASVDQASQSSSSSPFRVLYCTKVLITISVIAGTIIQSCTIIRRHQLLAGRDCNLYLSLIHISEPT